MLPAIAMLGGAAIGGLASYFGQKETNSANKQIADNQNEASVLLAKENRDWQERMANTAHQRQVKDLKDAGLNPILTATGGSGAATPSGGVAQLNSAKMENALGQGASSALASANLMKDLQMADSQKALNASAIDTQQSQQVLNSSTASKVMQDSIKVAQDNNIRSDALADMRDAASQQAKADLKRATMDNKMATYDAIQRRTQNAFDTLGSAKDAINPFKGLIGPGKNIPPAGEIFKNREGREGFYDRSGKFRTN